MTSLTRKGARTPHPCGLGRKPHFDQRNLRYLIRDVIAPRTLTMAATTPRLRRWPQWKRFDQGPTPRCTLFGQLTLLAAGPVHPKVKFFSTLDVDDLFAQIVAEDRAQGRFYDEGATTLAAMEVGKRLGWYGEYRWAYEMTDALAALCYVTPLAFGTNWYESMWDRDSEGIARIRNNSPIAGGHFYTVRGYDPKRDLYVHPSTWGDGDYLIPGDDMRRLLAEDGECVVVRELQIPT